MPTSRSWPAPAAGAVVTYTPPAGTDEQGGVASVARLPASGSTFPVGNTTVTCTATDVPGHAGTNTFQVAVGTLPNTAVPQPACEFFGQLAVLGLLGLGYLGLWRAAVARQRGR